MSEQQSIWADTSPFPTDVVAETLEVVRTEDGVLARPPSRGAIVGQLGMAFADFEMNFVLFPGKAEDAFSEPFRQVPRTPWRNDAANGSVVSMSPTAMERREKFPGFARRFSERQLELGLTYEQLARETGITSKTLSAWARNLHDPNPARLAPLARVLACSVAYLLHGKGEEPEHGNDRSSHH